MWWQTMTRQVNRHISALWKAGQKPGLSLTNNYFFKETITEAYLRVLSQKKIPNEPELILMSVAFCVNTQQ